MYVFICILSPFPSRLLFFFLLPFLHDVAAQQHSATAYSTAILCNTLKYSMQLSRVMFDMRYTASHINTLQLTLQYLMQANLVLGDILALHFSTTLGTRAVHCNALQHTATHSNALQCTATHRNALQRTATHRNALQRTATHCNAPHHSTTHCNTLQHTEAFCKTLHNTLQRR